MACLQILWNMKGWIHTKPFYSRFVTVTGILFNTTSPWSLRPPTPILIPKIFPLSFRDVSRPRAPKYLILSIAVVHFSGWIQKTPLSKLWCQITLMWLSGPVLGNISWPSYYSTTTMVRRRLLSGGGIIWGLSQSNQPSSSQEARSSTVRAIVLHRQ